MIKVAALTSGRHTPSSRFRVRQHIEPLREYGIVVREYVPRINKYAPIPGWPRSISHRYVLPLYAVWQLVKLSNRAPGLVGSWQAQVTWLERELLPFYSTLEGFLKRPLVFDVDDAIWVSNSRFTKTFIRAIARRADVVLAGNRYLAEWFVQYSQNVKIVHTAIDTDRFSPHGESGLNKDAFIIGWTGTAKNLRYLETLEDPLRRFLARYRDATLLVVADREPALPSLRSEQICFVEWTPTIEVDAVRRMSVGLMPLADDPWTRGKCSFKMLEYMSCEVPVIVSPVGMNADVLAMGDVGIAAKARDEWFEALVYFHQNRETARQCGRQGRAVAQQHFSRRVISAQLAEVFKQFH
jgi:glycosyltransferase involved in cell wall biosynthesis